MKIATIVGTRPELIKLSRVVAELDQTANHVLIHTGQNYDWELNGIFFKDLKIRKPDHFLEVVGSNLGETLGKIIEKSYLILKKEKPDALLILGDTNSCLSAISAKRCKVPIFHMEAGNRSFDECVPEEINRRIVDHISDINLVYTEHARRHLLSEGIQSQFIMKTGSPMFEVLEHYKDKIAESGVLEKLKLKDNSYFVVSIHREENVDSPLRLNELVTTIEKLAKHHDFPIIISTHPRTQKRLDENGFSITDSRINFIKPLGFFDYIYLQKHAACVLSDSGTITEESSILRFPAITLRDSHERPEGMDQGTIIMSGLQYDRVFESIEIVRKHYLEKHQFRMVPDYDSKDVSKKVVRIIMSYIDYVNRNVWKTI